VSKLLINIAKNLEVVPERDGNNNLWIRTIGTKFMFLRIRLVPAEEKYSYIRRGNENSVAKLLKHML
jgi:hypothetical protein